MADPLAPTPTPGIEQLLARMPKAELHLHLDGSLRPATALELARERGLVPSDLEEAGMRDLLVARMPCADQAELLRAFELPIAILQDASALERVAHELVEDVAGDGTRYAEIRWAPALHTRHGLGVRNVIEAVATGIRGGVGAVTESGGSIEARLICTAMRSHAPEDNERLAHLAVAARSDGVVGFDLAGPEAAYPDPSPHRRAFEVARSGGLGITIHAGEWGGAPQVRGALTVDPARIAHGAPAADDPALQAELIARGVTLDLCPTSNWQAGLVPRLADHPLPGLLRGGVGVTLNTDDRTVSDLTLTREYGRAHATLGLSLDDLWTVDQHALEAAFLHDEEPLRARLRAGFAAFSLVQGAPG